MLALPDVPEILGLFNRARPKVAEQAEALAKASWLQTDKTITNPYMGKGMLHCGQSKS